MGPMVQTKMVFAAQGFTGSLPLPFLPGKIASWKPPDSRVRIGVRPPEQVKLLEWMKNQERREAMLLITEDDSAMRLLIGWTLYNPKFKDRELKKTDDAVELSRRAWRDLDVDLFKLSNDSKVPFREAIDIFSRLQNAYLIFPDGTASSRALAITRGRASELLKYLTPPGGKGAE